MSTLTGASAGTIGDADETRSKRFKFADCSPKRQLRTIGLGRKELKRIRSACGEKVCNSSHGASLGPKASNASCHKILGESLYEKNVSPMCHY
jgi:hypothetical protein